MTRAPVRSAQAAAPWINELHYDNVELDVGEGVEIAGPAGLSLAGYRLEPRNGQAGAYGVVYDTVSLSGVLPDQRRGYGARFFATPLQNGSRDAIVLLAPDCARRDLVAYETAQRRCAGVFATDLGVFERPSTPIGQSLQRRGTGTSAADFAWATPRTASPGLPNAGQDFGPAARPRARARRHADADADAVARARTDAGRRGARAYGDRPRGGPTRGARGASGARDGPRRRADQPVAAVSAAGTVPLALVCPASAGACRTDISVSTTVRACSGRRTEVAIATAELDVAARGTVVVRLRLTRRGRSLLRERRVLRVVVAVRMHGADGTLAVSRRRVVPGPTPGSVPGLPAALARDRRPGLRSEDHGAPLVDEHAVLEHRADGPREHLALDVGRRREDEVVAQVPLDQGPVARLVGAEALADDLQAVGPAHIVELEVVRPGHAVVMGDLPRAEDRRAVVAEATLVALGEVGVVTGEPQDTGPEAQFVDARHTTARRAPRERTGSWTTAASSRR